jgi:hypothetical protein
MNVLQHYLKNFQKTGHLCNSGFGLYLYSLIEYLQQVALITVYLVL